MAVSYDYYRIFYHVAKYRSFTKAAAVLFSNQPNVTRAMNNLEHQLGCRLFLRSHRGVALTPEGEALYARVQIAQEQLQTAEAELAAAKGLQSGSVAVGASETALHCLLLPVLRQFRHQWPGVRLRITNHSTPQAVAAVRSGAVELAVVTTPTGAAPPLQQTPLCPFEEALVAGPAHAGLAAEPLPLGELARYPLVCLGRNTQTFAFYSDLFARQGVDLCPEVEAATADQILPMVENDLGLGFVPRALASAALQEGRVVEIPLAEPLPRRQICLVRDKARPQGAAARELERLLRQAGAAASQAMAPA